MFAQTLGVEIRDHQVCFADSTTIVSTFHSRGRSPTSLRPCVLYIHGGGFEFGDRYSNTEELMTMVASEEIVGVSLDYRLAPKHRFPAALNDCENALKWVIANAPRLNIDVTRIVIMGVSAGGALAASLAIRLRQRGPGDIAGLLLSCPMLDDRTSAGPESVGPVRTWTYADNRAAWKKYLGHTIPTYESVPARALNLSLLPPTFIDVGSDDIFYQEDVEFAAGLRRSSVLVEMHTWILGYHGFDILERSSPAAVQAAQVRLSWIRSRISAASDQSQQDE